MSLAARGQMDHRLRHELTEAEASLYEAPFDIFADVKSRRATRTDVRGIRVSGGAMVKPGPVCGVLSPMRRYIVTPRRCKASPVRMVAHEHSPDQPLVVIARDDDTTFGILHSRFHELWSLRLGTWLGVGNDPRYTPTTTFETFPFPEGLTPNIPAADYAADPRARPSPPRRRDLNEMRKAWLNPPDLVKRVPEVVPGYPDRILPMDDAAAAILKKRTLTNLYNQRPAWLDHAHRASTPPWPRPTAGVTTGAPGGSATTKSRPPIRPLRGPRGGVGGASRMISRHRPLKISKALQRSDNSVSGWPDEARLAASATLACMSWNQGTAPPWVCRTLDFLG